MSVEKENEIHLRCLIGTVLIIIVFFVFLFIMQNTFWNNKQTRINYFENRLNHSTEFLPEWINDNTTLGEMKQKYYWYKPASEYILNYELNKLCNKK